MSLNTPSPQPRPVQAQLQPSSSVLSTPSFTSTLPHLRPLSASSAFRRPSQSKRNRLGSSRHQRTRLVASSVSHSSDGSLGDFSMENYTIDVAQLGTKTEGTRPVGFEEGLQRESIKAKTASPVARGLHTQASGEEGRSLLGNYTLDLGGLGDKPSSVVVEDREQEHDEVASEDEGPEDFTQNLEVWMRGTQKWKKEKEDDIVEEGKQSPEPELNNQDVGREEGPMEESVFEPLGTSTPAPLRNHAIIEQGVEEEARLQAPPLTRLNTEAMQDRAAEEVFDRISALQSEVERMRIEDEHRRVAHQVLEKEYEELKREHDATEERNEAIHSNLKAERQRLQQDYNEMEDSLRQENTRIKNDHKQAMGRLCTAHEETYRGKSTEDTAQQNDFELLKKELKDVRATAAQESEQARSDIQRLNNELEASRRETQDLQQTMDSIQEATSVKIREVTSELEIRSKEVALERKESIDRANEAATLAETVSQKDKELRELISEAKAIKMELDHAHKQLAETRRIVETVEDENDRLAQQNERQANDIAELHADINVKAMEYQTATTIQGNSIDQETHKAALEALSHQHQATIVSLNASHTQEVQSLRETLRKAGQAMQKRLVDLTKSHDEEISSLQKEIDALKLKQLDLPPPKPKTSDTETELRSAIRVLNSKLEKSNKLLTSTREDLRSAQQDLQEQQESNVLINAELERKFADAVEARETEWRRRVNLLFREREKMGKALMLGWGREEVGRGEQEKGQGYRYRYVKREKGGS